MLSNVRGVRLLWEEDALDAIGAFCVGAFVLGTTWMVLEGLLGASPFLAGLMAAAAAVFTLGEISRQRYPERRSYSSRHVPAGAVAAMRPHRVGDEDVAESSEAVAADPGAAAADSEVDVPDPAAAAAEGSGARRPSARRTSRARRAA